jgi:hypothetical protein
MRVGDDGRRISPVKSMGSKEHAGSKSKLRRRHAGSFAQYRH